MAAWHETNVCRTTYFKKDKQIACGSEAQQMGALFEKLEIVGSFS